MHFPCKNPNSILPLPTEKKLTLQGAKKKKKITIFTSM